MSGSRAPQVVGLRRLRRSVSPAAVQSGQAGLHSSSPQFVGPTLSEARPALFPGPYFPLLAGQPTDLKWYVTAHQGFTVEMPCLCLWGDDAAARRRDGSVAIFSSPSPLTQPPPPLLSCCLPSAMLPTGKWVRGRGAQSATGVRASSPRRVRSYP